MMGQGDFSRENSYLSGTKLWTQFRKSANLAGANLSDATLTDAKMRFRSFGVNLTGATMPSEKTWKNEEDTVRLRMGVFREMRAASEQSAIRDDEDIRHLISHTSVPNVDVFVTHSPCERSN
jgi:hypothetical protein